MRDLFINCRKFFIYTGIFSLVINLLMLTPALFLLVALDKVLSSRSIETLVMLTVLAVFALSIGSMMSSVRSKLLNRLGITIHRILGQPVLAILLKYSDRETHGKHGLNDVKTIHSFLTGNGVVAFLDLPWVPLYVAIIFLFSPILAIYAVVAIVILFMLAVLEDKVTHKDQLLTGSYSRMTDDFLDVALSNREIVSALGMQDNIMSHWQQRNQLYMDKKSEVDKKVASIKALTKFVNLNIRLLALATAAYLVLSQNLSPGIMIASNIILGQALQPIGSIIGVWSSFIDFSGAYQRLDVLTKEDDTSYSSRIELPKPEGRLEVERVLFYLAKDRNILNGISFKLEPGESLGVIGSSASGKTSLARLLVGIHKPNDGSLRLDGADIHLWSRNGLGKHIGYVPQDIQLLAGTVAENICRLGNPKIHEQEIIYAARRAKVDDMILKLPEGYDTQIGEGACLLSGGQRQQLALARALFGRPSFLVLDEPNSNLDGESELALLDVLENLKAERVTVVVISHKPTLIQEVDKLLALQNGYVVKFSDRQDVLSQISFS